MRNTESGFTLVELSIVLVIIGLLIGGILVAQSMVTTATIQAQIKQIGEWDTAVNNFKAKYASLPGDSDKFPNPGNNDGIIYGDSLGTSHARFIGDAQFVWKHLQQGVGLYTDFNFNTSGHCDGGGAYACTAKPPNLNLPPAKIAKKVGVMIAYDVQMYNAKYNAYSFMIADGSGNSSDLRYNSAPLIPCDMILSVDKKLDDGVETAGNVRGGLSKVAFGNATKFDCDGYTSLNLKGEMLVRMLMQSGSY